MDQTSTSYKILKNVSYSLLGFGIPILVSVITVPLIVKGLGATEYGILILANTIIAFLSLLDLGLSAGLSKFITQYKAIGDFTNLQKIVNNAYSLYWFIGLFGLGVFFVIGKFFLQMFKIQGVSQQHIFIVFLLAGMVFFVNSFTTIFSSISIALQRFDIVNKLSVLQLVVYNFSVAILLFFGFQLKVIMLANLLSFIGLAYLYYIKSKELLPELKFRFSFDREKVKELYSFGLVVAFSNFNNNLLNNLDRLLIPIFLNPTQLTFYSLSGNVAMKTANVTGSLGGIFFPLATELSSKNETSNLGIIYRKVIRNLVVVSFSIAFSLALFGKEILFYWLGQDFVNNGYVVLLILCLTYWILSIYGILYNFLLGMNKEKKLAKWTFVLAMINLVSLVLLIKPFGIVGVAWAYLIGVLPILYLFYQSEKELFGFTDIVAFYFKLLWRLLVAGTLFAFIIKFLIIKLVYNIIGLVIIGPASVILFLGIYLFLGFFEEEDLTLFRLFFGKALKRIGFSK